MGMPRPGPFGTVGEGRKPPRCGALPRLRRVSVPTSRRANRASPPRS